MVKIDLMLASLYSIHRFDDDMHCMKYIQSSVQFDKFHNIKFRAIVVGL